MSWPGGPLGPHLEPLFPSFSLSNMSSSVLHTGCGTASLAWNTVWNSSWLAPFHHWGFSLIFRASWSPFLKCHLQYTASHDFMFLFSQHLPLCKISIFLYLLFFFLLSLPPESWVPSLQGPHWLYTLLCSQHLLCCLLQNNSSINCGWLWMNVGQSTSKNRVRNLIFRFDMCYP